MPDLQFTISADTMQATRDAQKFIATMVEAAEAVKRVGAEGRRASDGMKEFGASGQVVGELKNHLVGIAGALGIVTSAEEGLRGIVELFGKWRDYQRDLVRDVAATRDATARFISMQSENAGGRYEQARAAISAAGRSTTAEQEAAELSAFADLQRMHGGDFDAAKRAYGTRALALKLGISDDAVMASMRAGEASGITGEAAVAEAFMASRFSDRDPSVLAEAMPAEGVFAHSATSYATGLGVAAALPAWVHDKRETKGAMARLGALVGDTGKWEKTSLSDAALAGMSEDEAARQRLLALTDGGLSDEQMKKAKWTDADMETARLLAGVRGEDLDKMQSVWRSSGREWAEPGLLAQSVEDVYEAAPLVRADDLRAEAESLLRSGQSDTAKMRAEIKDAQLQLNAMRAQASGHDYLVDNGRLGGFAQGLPAFLYSFTRGQSDPRDYYDITSPQMEQQQKVIDHLQKLLPIVESLEKSNAGMAADSNATNVNRIPQPAAGGQ